MKLNAKGKVAARRARNIFRTVSILSLLAFLLFAVINIALGKYEDGNLLISLTYIIVALTISSIPYAFSLMCQAMEDDNDAREKD